MELYEYLNPVEGTGLTNQERKSNLFPLITIPLHHVRVLCFLQIYF